MSRFTSSLVNNAERPSDNAGPAIKCYGWQVSLQWSLLSPSVEQYAISRVTNSLKNVMPCALQIVPTNKALKTYSLAVFCQTYRTVGGPSLLL